MAEAKKPRPQATSAWAEGVIGGCVELQGADLEWVRAMLTWITDPRSEGHPKKGFTQANWKSLKRASVPLALGEGVSYHHLPGHPIFKGTKMDPRVYNAEEARRVASRWLPLPKNTTSQRPLDHVTDATKGWTIDHLLGYMARWARSTGADFAALRHPPAAPPRPPADRLDPRRHVGAGGLGPAGAKPARARKRPRAEEPQPEPEPDPDPEPEPMPPPPDDPKRTSPSLEIRPDTDGAEAFNDFIEREFNKIDNITPKQLAHMDRVLNKQKELEYEKGNRFWNVQPILLRRVAPLINDPKTHRQMTTGQTEKWIDETFASMTDAEFNRGYYGLEVYYERNPNARHNIRYRPIRPAGVRAYTIDHVLVQAFSPFDHPRFYIVLPAGGLNAALSSRGVVWRTSTVIGITKSELRLLTNDLKAMKVLLQKEMPSIYARLPAVCDTRLV